MENMEGNHEVILKEHLPKYDSVSIKEKLRGNIFLLETGNLLLDEIKIGTKRHYKKLQAKIIIVRSIA
jgi:hypothetical protein